MKSLPLLVRRVRKQGGSATLPEVRSLAERARTVDHERWAVRADQVGVRERLRAMSERGARSNSDSDSGSGEQVRNITDAAVTQVMQ
jgi:hypothetical protein